MMKRTNDGKGHLILAAAGTKAGLTLVIKMTTVLIVMNYLSTKTLLKIFLSILALSTAAFAQESPVLKIFPPDNGEIRLENSFGDIEVVVWQENYVGVSTSVLPSKSKKSPLDVVRLENELRIKVAANLYRNQYPITLKLKVPGNSKLRISTGKGIININGLPKSLTVQRVSVEINFMLP
jgi:hypothetical protein